MNRPTGTTLAPRMREAREQAPPALRGAGARARAAACARGLVLVHDLHAVLDLLDLAGIEALSFKGPVLEAGLGGDPFTRDPDDLDLLVRRRDLARALELLGREGWTPALDVHPESWPLLVRLGCEVPLARPGRSLLDLHWDLAPAYFAWRPDQEALRARARTVAVAGRPVRTLSRADGFLHLCAHGCLSDWTRATWVDDVARALAGLSADDAARVLGEARRTGARRMLAVGVRLAARLRGATAPVGLRPADLADPAADRVAGLYAAALEGSAPLPPDGPARVALHLRTRERLRDRLRHAAGLLHVPARDEWSGPPAAPPARWSRRIARALRARPRTAAVTATQPRTKAGRGDAAP